MNKEDFNRSKIIKIEPHYTKGGRWIFSLTYKLWDDNGNVAELNIPYVENPFYDNINVIELHQDWKTEFGIRDGHNNLIHPKHWIDHTANIKTRGKVDIYAGDDSNKSLNHNSFCSIKYIKKKMTIDDIEKVLGYKVEIIDKENKED